MKLTLVELNEFNKELLEQAAIDYNLPSLKKLVAMKASSTFTDDTYESDFLEPWVQWVSVHTGAPSKDHKIKHLGDVPNLETQQLWEALSDKDVSSIVWGAMNASRRSATNNLAFLPDPWTIGERAYPEELNHILDPLRAVSTNYLQPDKKKIFKMLKKLGTLFKENGLISDLFKQIPTLMKELLRFKGAHFVFIAFTEYFSTRLFLKYKRNHNPDFSLIFINTLAHIQHHHWKGFNYKNNQKLKLGLYYIDKMLEEIFSALDNDEVFILTNALSQKNTNNDPSWILYRPLNHSSFLKAAGIDPLKIQEHMTHDAHIYFASVKECLRAKKLLEEAKISNASLFVVESYQEDPFKLFYRLAFTDKVSDNDRLSIGDKNLHFLSFYQNIVERTGKHIPEGTCYCNLSVLPEKFYNHELSREIINIFISKNLELMK